MVFRESLRQPSASASPECRPQAVSLQDRPLPGPPPLPAPPPPLECLVGDGEEVGGGDLNGRGAATATASVAESAEGSKGNARADLVRDLFETCDCQSGDGVLDEREMRTFADHTGFTGSDEEWAVEFKALCMEYQGSAGLDAAAFARLLEDRSEKGCYCSDADLVKLNALLGDKCMLTASSCAVAPLAPQESQGLAVARAATAAAEQSVEVVPSSSSGSRRRYGVDTSEASLLKEIRAAFSARWRSSDGGQYSFKEAPGGSNLGLWTCEKTGGMSQRFLRYRIFWDPEGKRVYWQDNYFMMPADLFWNPNKIVWHGVNEYVARRPHYVWARLNPDGSLASRNSGLEPGPQGLAETQQLVAFPSSPSRSSYVGGIDWNTCVTRRTDWLVGIDLAHKLPCAACLKDWCAWAALGLPALGVVGRGRNRGALILDMSHNFFGDEGFGALVNLLTPAEPDASCDGDSSLRSPLAGGVRLLHLNLRRCRLGAESVPHLVRLLRGLCGQRAGARMAPDVLDISFNFLDKDAIAHVIIAAATSTFADTGVPTYPIAGWKSFKLLVGRHQAWAVDPDRAKQWSSTEELCNDLESRIFAARTEAFGSPEGPSVPALACGDPLPGSFEAEKGRTTDGSVISSSPIRLIGCEHALWHRKPLGRFGASGPPAPAPIAAAIETTVAAIEATATAPTATTAEIVGKEGAVGTATSAVTPTTAVPCTSPEQSSRGPPAPAPIAAAIATPVPAIAATATAPPTAITVMTVEIVGKEATVGTTTSAVTPATAAPCTSLEQSSQGASSSEEIDGVEATRALPGWTDGICLRHHPANARRCPDPGCLLVHLDTTIPSMRSRFENAAAGAAAASDAGDAGMRSRVENAAAGAAAASDAGDAGVGAGSAANAESPSASAQGQSPLSPRTLRLATLSVERWMFTQVGPVGEAAIVLCGQSLQREYTEACGSHLPAVDAWAGLRSAVAYYSERQVRVHAVVPALGSKAAPVPADLGSIVLTAPMVSAAQESCVTALVLVKLAMALNCCVVADSVDLPPEEPEAMAWLQGDGGHRRIEFIFHRNGVFTPLRPPPQLVPRVGVVDEDSDEVVLI